MENPVQILITEHDLIERLIEVFKKNLANMKATHKVDSQFIEIVADCFETFINRIHHWKEENVYFKALSKKPLSEKHQAQMKKLIEEHNLTRICVGKIVESNMRYVKGDVTGFKDVIEHIEKFVLLYEPHIHLENQSFFPETLNYFDDHEKAALEALFKQVESEPTLIKYQTILENLES